MMKKMICAGAALLFFAACNSVSKTAAGAPELFSAADYDTVIDGRPVSLYTISNANGMTAQITNYGAVIASLWVPAADGTFKNVVVGYPAIADYFKPGNTSLAAVIGPYANRIAKGQFTLDGRTYQLPVNNGENTLHGGDANFAKKVWNIRPVSDSSVALSYVSPADVYGFPGNLSVSVFYTVTPENALKIEYIARSDAPTVINLTNHAYFNLHGGDHRQSVNSHILQINSSFYTPTDEGLIPTGEILPVEGTALDFRTPAAVGARMMDDDPIFDNRYGYDHNYVIVGVEQGKMVEAAVVSEPATGIVMTTLTDMPGVQFFTGRSRTEQDTTAPAYRSAVCLEAQNYPDAPNHADFPPSVLRPGDVYRRTCAYRFSVDR